MTNERERRARMRRRIGRGWLRNSRGSEHEVHIEMARCIAYLDNGNLCRKPAEFIDPIRGGMVCEEHRPK